MIMCFLMVGFQHGTPTYLSLIVPRCSFYSVAPRVILCYRRKRLGARRRLPLFVAFSPPTSFVVKGIRYCSSDQITRVQRLQTHNSVSP